MKKQYIIPVMTMTHCAPINMIAETGFRTDSNHEFNNPDDFFIRGEEPQSSWPTFNDDEEW